VTDDSRRDHRLGLAATSQAAEFATEVRTDIQRADNACSRSSLFAISLFFAALSTRPHTFGSRATLLGMGYALFVGTIWLATQPVSVSS